LAEMFQVKLVSSDSDDEVHAGNARAQALLAVLKMQPMLLI